jgi:hypothetical protein
MGSSPEMDQSVRMAMDVLTRAGFILNLTQSELTPSQDLTYIGSRLQTDLGKVFLPPLPRMEALMKCLKGGGGGGFPAAKVFNRLG